MEHLINIIQANVEYAPLLIFGSLLLAGLNIPVSEDAMLFISGFLASRHPDMTAEFFAGVFGGAYLSDLICYWLGRKLGENIWRIRFFAKMAPPERVRKISEFYEKYGMVTLIFGRFIPFGVRNGLFLTAGIGRMNFLKFAVYDLVACTISTVVFFSLYYTYGKRVVHYVRQGNIVVFSVVALAVTGYILFRWIRTRKRDQV